MNFNIQHFTWTTALMNIFKLSTELGSV